MNLQFVHWKFLYMVFTRIAVQTTLYTKAIPKLRRYDEYGVVSCTQAYLLHGKTRLDLRESRRAIVIIRLITPLPVTWNEATRPWGPWKHSLPGNLTLLFHVTVKNDFSRVKFEIFDYRLIFRHFSGENISKTWWRITIIIIIIIVIKKLKTRFLWFKNNLYCHELKFSIFKRRSNCDINISNNFIIPFPQSLLVFLSSRHLHTPHDLFIVTPFIRLYMHLRILGYWVTQTRRTIRIVFHGDMRDS